MFFRAAGVIPVEEPTRSCWTDPFSWSLLGGDPHLLAEDLADLAAHEGVVAAEEADLGAAAAERAAVGQLREAREGLPVEVDVAAP